MRSSWWLLPFAIACALSLVFTFPVWLRPATTLYGDHPSDAMGSVYGLWYGKQRTEGRLNPGDIDTRGAPLERVQPPVPLAWYRVGDKLQARLAVCLGEVAAFNLYILGSFFLTALIFPFLVQEALSPSDLSDRSDLSNKFRERQHTRTLISAAVIGTVVFTLSPYHLTQAQEHDKLASVQWIALFVWMLLRFLNRATVASAFVAFASWVWCCLWDLQLGYFTAVLGGSVLVVCGWWFVVGRLRTPKGERRATGGQARLAVAGLIVVAMLVGAATTKIYPTLRHIQRPVEQMYEYAAHPRNYFLPPASHPVFGRFAEDVLKRLREKPESADPVKAQYLPDETLNRLGLETELSLYLGWVPLLLSIYALTSLYRHRRRLPREFRIAVAFAVAGFVGFVWSLPPTVSVGGPPVSMPSGWLHSLLPMFRVSARFGVMVVLCVGVLASLGLFMLLDQVRLDRVRTVTGCFVFLIVFEFANFPPLRHIASAPAPQTYSFLAHQPRESIIAEYPIRYWYEWKHLEYLFRQRVHGKPLLNGAMPSSEAYPVLEVVRDLSDPATIPLLQLLDVRYLVVHEKQYRTNPKPWVRDLKEVARSAESIVYEVAVRPDNPLRDRFANAETASRLTAEEVFATALRMGIVSPRLLLYAGERCAQVGKWRDAAGYFDKLVRLQPDNGEAFLRLGTCLLYLNRPADAVPRLERAAALLVDDAEVHLLLGSAYRFLPNGQTKARAHFRECLRLQPDHSGRKPIEEFLNASE